MYKASKKMNEVIEKYLGKPSSEIIHEDGRTLTPQSDAFVNNKQALRGSVRLAAGKYRTAADIEDLRASVLNHKPR